MTTQNYILYFSHVINENGNELKETISMSEFENQIIKNISSFLNSTNVINGTDFIAMIYEVDDMEPKEQLKNGISAIDLGNCSKVIKDYYNISSFIVLNMESKKNKTQEKNIDNSFDLRKNIYLDIYRRYKRIRYSRSNKFCKSRYRCI